MKRTVVKCGSTRSRWAVMFLACLTMALPSTPSSAAEPIALDAEDPLGSPVLIAVDVMPLDRFVTQLAALAPAVPALSGSLEGRVSGRFDGTVADVLDALVTEHRIAWWSFEGRLHIVPASAVRSGMRAIPSSLSALLARELSETLRADARNTIEPTVSGLSYRGVPAFIEAVEAALEDWQPPAPASVPVGVPDTPAYDGVEAIPGFYES